MNPKIVFYDQKIEIILKTGFVTYHYRKLMYVVYRDLYCTLHFVDNEKYTVETTLKEIEDNMPEATFARCNRKTIVNLYHCKRYDRTISEIQMDDNVIFTLSRRNKTDFKAKRKNLPRISSCTY